MSTREEIRQAYQILGLSEGSSEAEIKRKYRDLSMRWHPDKWAGKSEYEKKHAEKKMKEINNAKDILDKKDSINDESENNNYSYTSENLATSEDKAEAKRIIRESLVRTEFTQAEFENLMRGTRSEFQQTDERYINFSSKIDKLITREELLSYLNEILKMISACYENKLADDLENAFRESENWSKSWQNDWESSWTSNSYSSGSWYEKYTEECKKKYIDEIESSLRLKSVPEKRLNKKLGVSDWRNEINKHSDSLEALKRKFKIDDAIYALTREFTCAHCNQKKDDLYFPWETDGKKFCSYEHQNLWRRKNRKENPIGGIIALALLIMVIIWLVKRRKKMN